MTIADIRRTINSRVTTALTLQAAGAVDELGMALALLRYDLDDLEAAAKADGEAEGKRKAMAECDVLLAQSGVDRA